MAQLRSKTASSIQHNSVLAVTSQFVVTSQSLRGHNVVATQSLWLLRSLYAESTVTMRTLRLLRSQKEHIFETEKNAQLRSKTDYLIKTLLPY